MPDLMFEAPMQGIRTFGLLLFSQTGSVVPSGAGRTSAVIGSQTTFTVYPNVPMDGVPGTVLASQRYALPFPLAGGFFFRVLMSGELEIELAAAGGTIAHTLDVQLDGVAIAGVTAVQGSPFDVTQVATTRQRDIIQVLIPVVNFTAGQTLEMVHQLVLVVAGPGGSTTTLRLNHDPAAAGRELFYSLATDSGPGVA